MEFKKASYSTRYRASSREMAYRWQLEYRPYESPHSAFDLREGGLSPTRSREKYESKAVCFQRSVFFFGECTIMEELKRNTL